MLKGKNAYNNHFLLFKQCFIPYQVWKSPFELHLSPGKSFDLFQSKILLFLQSLGYLIFYGIQYDYYGIISVTGDLRDDHNPDFLREYHKALAVVCDDLFFARFRKSTSGSIKNEPSPAGSVQLLQEMFGKCHTEDEKVKMVDDLLDVKLLPSTTTEGVHFNTERLKER